MNAGGRGRGNVFALGFGMLGGGLALLLWLGLGIAGGTGYWPAAAGRALAAAILFYDWHHKNNPLSPLVMGLCRVLVYVTAGLSVAVPLPGGHHAANQMASAGAAALVGKAAHTPAGTVSPRPPTHDPPPGLRPGNPPRAQRAWRPRPRS